MTSAPADLLTFRAAGMAVTGLAGNAFGIAPDAAHLAGGGYHVGVNDIARTGRFHLPTSAHIGSSTEDYSVRQARDRRAGTNTASATDVGSTWRHGGRAAWIRWNNLLFQEMRDRPQNLPALRAINVALDGKTKRRYDQLHRGDGLVPSADTVDSHTHLEFFRDTEGRRQQTLDRIVQLMRAAVAGTPIPEVEADVQLADQLTIPNYDKDPALPAVESTTVGTAIGVASQRSWQAYHNTRLLLALVEAVAAKVDIDPAELEQIREAAKTGAAEAFADQRQDLVDGIVAALPQDKDGSLTVSDVRAVLVDVLLHGAADAA